MATAEQKAQLEAARAELQRLEAEAVDPLEVQLAEVTAKVGELTQALGAANAALSAAQSGMVQLSASDLCAVECANKSQGVFPSADAAKAYADTLNSQRSAPHPDNEFRVLPLAEYVQQLEAAVSHVEWLHAEQKTHMKRIHADKPATPKSIEP
jgi:hypothetical protein